MKKGILIAVYLMVVQASAGQPAQDAPSQIKILSWNIYMLPGFLSKSNQKRAAVIGEVLSHSDYDVIVFQEAFCPFARHKIAQQLESQFSYHAGPANRKWFSMKTNSGIWIVSKHPILSYHSIVFKNRHGFDALSRKGALMVELQIGRERVQIVGTHLQNSGNESLRTAQCVELSERLLNPNRIAGVAQIVCGDFNINKQASEESYRFMLTSLEAEDGILLGEHQFTYDRLHNDLHIEKGNGQDLIDYILVRNNGALVDCATRRIPSIKKRWSTLHEDLSDHYPIEMKIFFTNYSRLISSR